MVLSKLFWFEDNLRSFYGIKLLVIDNMMLVPVILGIVVVILFLLIIVINKQQKTIKVLVGQLEELNLLFPNLQQSIQNNQTQIDQHQQKTVDLISLIEKNKKNAEQTIAPIAQELNSLKNSIDLLVNQQPEDKLYSRAYKLAALGADVDEIAQSCEIPIAEAEMLLAVHQKKSVSK